MLVVTFSTKTLIIPKSATWYDWVFLIDAFLNWQYFHLIYIFCLFTSLVLIPAQTVASPLLRSINPRNLGVIKSEILYNSHVLGRLIFFLASFINFYLEFYVRANLHRQGIFSYSFYRDMVFRVYEGMWLCNVCSLVVVYNLKFMHNGSAPFCGLLILTILQIISSEASFLENYSEQVQ